jgi:CHAD domain-containing protein
MGKKSQDTTCIYGANYMLEQLNNIEQELDGAIIGEDIEYIHRLRVATRRLRSGMACFRECLPNKKTKPWQDDVKRITQALGNARDLDIQLDCVNQLYDQNLEEKIKPGYRRILLRLKQKREKAQVKVIQRLEDLRKSDFIAQLRERFEKQSETSGLTYLYTPSLYQKAFENIRGHLDDFLGFEKYIHDPANIEKLHAMRIAGKHLRYTLEIFAPIYGKTLIPYTQVMKDLQDQLGTIHDDDVWISWLPKFIEQERERIEDYFGNRGPLKRLLPGINHLIEDRQQDRDREYHAFISTWEAINGEDAWKNLRTLINAPINIEAALEHLNEHDQPTPDNEPSEDEIAEAEPSPGLDDTRSETTNPQSPSEAEG